MNLRRFAALVAPLALTVSSLTLTTVHATAAPPSSVEALVAQMQQIGDVSDPGDEAGHPSRHTDTASLYRRAGLARSGMGAANTDASTSAATSSANTNPAGQILPPGIRDHVDQICTGTGTDGDRVQVMYVRETDMPDRYAQVVPILRNETRYIDDVFAVASKETGGGRRVRWVTNSDCTINVLNVVLPDGALSGDFNKSETALTDAGYLKTHRKYLAFADVPVGAPGATCGQGRLLPDSNPTDNKNDGRYPQLARIDASCWVTTAEYNAPALHELLHTLGAIQTDAPHATGGFHCTDESDVMCYNDGWATPTQVCPVTSEFDIDCNKDDYFNTNPPAGSYLATHWNVANSPFLQAVPALSDPPTINLTTSNTTPQVGDYVRFTASVPAGTTVTWSTDVPTCDTTGDSHTGTTFRLQCFQEANPTVTATASNGGITVSYATSTVTYQPSADPVLGITGPTNVVVGTPFTMQAHISNSSAAWTYNWVINTSGCTTSNGLTNATLDVTCGPAAENAGVVSFSVTATRTADGLSLFSTGGASIKPAGTPTATIYGLATVVAGTNGSYAVVTDATHATYSWRSSHGWGTGSTNTSSYKVAPPASAGGQSDTLSVLVTNTDTGKSTTAYLTYSVEPVMTMTLTGPANIAPGDTKAFTANPSKSAEMAWDVDEPSCTLAATSNVNVDTLTCPADYTGTVTVTVTATRGAETLTRSKSVTVTDVLESTITTLRASTGYPTTMTVILQDASGAAVPGQTVNIQSLAGDVWTTVAQATTGATGRATVSVPVKSAATYRAQYDGNASFASSASKAVPLKVVTKMDNLKITGGLRMTLKTAWGYAVPGMSVGLQKKVVGSTRWVNVNKYLTNSSGQVTVRVNPTKRTDYRWVFAGTPVYVESTSGSVRLT